MISQTQKQALIDNLQLEVTERARKLRAQYALQAQGLKMRVEMRLNRIPTSLRKTTIGELIERHKPQVRDESGENKSPQKFESVANQHLANRQEPSKAVLTNVLPSARGLKRSSKDISTDKENETHIDLLPAKRRPKLASSTSRPKITGPTRAAPKTKLKKSQVLSQSSNIRNPSRPDARQRNDSNNSHDSLSSSGTILVTKNATKPAGKLGKKDLKRKAIGISDLEKRVAAPSEYSSSRRVLRKRV
ncbi:MAG: hypothetical protein M1829_002429 [Trizodia sp. TS-e1964]|nr:MAG: hypothetical protein M1829_002429 [Trizodia sp. TS-e1964]